LSNTQTTVSQLAEASFALSEAANEVADAEIRAEIATDEEKFKIAEMAKEFFADNYEVIDVDGVRIQFGDGWGLVRASNTQPVLVLRFEARTPERLEEIKSLVVGKLKEFGDVKI